LPQGLGRAEEQLIAALLLAQAALHCEQAQLELDQIDGQLDKGPRGGAASF
jgi:hypothetical protein